MGKKENRFYPSATDDPIAPDAIIAMVSCKSCKLCKEGSKCSCRQANQPCTDFCGCSEYCENTDNTMPVNIMDDDDELVDVF